MLFFQYDNTKIDIDISKILSNNPCFGALHYDDIDCDCDIQVFLELLFDISV